VRAPELDFHRDLMHKSIKLRSLESRQIHQVRNHTHPCRMPCAKVWSTKMNYHCLDETVWPLAQKVERNLVRSENTPSCVGYDSK
jgi:hypothetical protein